MRTSNLLAIGIVAGILGGHALVYATHDTDIRLASSICRWDPSYDGQIWTFSQFDMFQVTNTSATNGAIVLCGVPFYYGRDSANHQWGLTIGDLQSGATRVFVHDGNSSDAVSAQFVQTTTTGSFSVCSAVLTGTSFTGPTVLYPNKCSSSYPLVSILVGLPPGPIADSYVWATEIINAT